MLSPVTPSVHLPVNSPVIRSVSSLRTTSARSPCVSVWVSRVSVTCTCHMLASAVRRRGVLVASGARTGPGRPAEWSPIGRWRPGGRHGQGAGGHQGELSWSPALAAGSDSRTRRDNGAQTGISGHMRSRWCRRLNDA